jgi:hypothetical protein
MEPTTPPAATAVAINWIDGTFRVELRGQAAGLRLRVIEGDELVFEEMAPTAAAGARRGQEIVAAIRRGERPDYERGSA